MFSYRIQLSEFKIELVLSNAVSEISPIDKFI